MVEIDGVKTRQSFSLVSAARHWPLLSYSKAKITYLRTSITIGLLEFSWL